MAELPADLDELLKVIDAAPDWEREVDMNCNINEAIVTDAIRVNNDPQARTVECKSTAWEIVLTKVGRDGSEAEDEKAEALARLFTVVDRKTLRELVVALRDVKVALGVYDQRSRVTHPCVARCSGLAAVGCVLAADLHKVLSP